MEIVSSVKGQAVTKLQFHGNMTWCFVVVVVFLSNYLQEREKKRL